MIKQFSTYYIQLFHHNNIIIMIIHQFMKMYQNILTFKMIINNKMFNTPLINKLNKMTHKYVKEDLYVTNNK